LLQLVPKKFVGQLANVQVIRYPSSAGSLIQSDSAGSPFALSMIFFVEWLVYAGNEFQLFGKIGWLL